MFVGRIESRNVFRRRIAPLKLSAVRAWLSTLALSKQDLQNRGSYVIGYPKSGNTWLRVMLGKYFQMMTGHDENSPLHLFDYFEDIDSRLPLIRFTHGGLTWNLQTGSDLNIKDHVFPYRDYRVVLLVRNIPDVLVSNYWQLKTRTSPPYEGEISDFIRDQVHGVEKAIGFFRLWSEAHTTIREFLLLRYEDLKIQTAHELQRLLEFWHVPLDEEYVSRSIAYGDFGNMRELEQKNKGSRTIIYPSSGLSIFGTGDTGKSEEAFHVRRGVVGGYLDYLSSEDIEFLQKKMAGKVPKMYGYPGGFWHGAT